LFIFVSVAQAQTPTQETNNADIYQKINHLQNLIYQLRQRLTASVIESSLTEGPVLLTKNLARGSSGQEVRTLQDFLSTNSYLSEADVTGYYGISTENAVKTYQCQKALVCSGTPLSTGYGMVGPKTREAINADILLAYNNRYAIKPGFHDLTFSTPAGNRSFYLYVPTAYRSDKANPLVMFFHGGGGNKEQAKVYGLQDKADEAGFLLVLANGASAFSGGQLATWNAGECCGYARDTNSDDVSYAKMAIAEVQKRARVDQNRIYATGMSNGGMMSYRLACEESDTFAAIAAVAGTDNTITCAPTEDVSILHIHALDDDHVLYEGGIGGGAFEDDTKITDFTSVPETIQSWLSHNALYDAPVRTFETDENGGAYCDSYQNQSRFAKKTEVKLCTTKTGGHSWPGSESYRDKTPSQAISANDVIWDFFESHTKLSIKTAL
jgi:polyhydroxybutyrate depolymerase